MQVCTSHMSPSRMIALLLVYLLWWEVTRSGVLRR